jgi:hypothetical protein
LGDRVGLPRLDPALLSRFQALFRLFSREITSARVYVIVMLTAVLSVVFALAFFIWAARKDGQADRVMRS